VGRIARGLTLAALVLLAGCGFQLRGVASLPFASLHVAGATRSSLVADLERRIEINGSKLDAAERAEAVVQIQGERYEKKILSLSGAGRVREFQLVYTVSYALHARDGREISPLTTIELLRDFSYDDSLALAKEHEEALLRRDMERDAADQILRRISLLKP
jgi:LPS-assembly lipoprotein